MIHRVRASFLSAVLLLLAVSPGPASSQAEGDPITLGSYRILHSEILDEDRVLQVHLPRGYEESALDYPVLYLLYSDQVAEYYAETVSVLSLLGIDLMPRAILVGIANTDRYRDLFPWPSRDGWGGGADRFLRFVREELVPFVDARYRTKDYRIMVGPQAGGVFGAYALLEDPGLFQAFILNDPCRIDNDEHSLCREVSRFAATPEAKGLFFAVSHEAGDERGAPTRLEELRAAFQNRAVDGSHWRVELDSSWKLFLPPLHLRENLLELFSGYRFPADQEITGLSDVLSHYEALSRRYGFPVDPPDHILAQVSDRLTGEGRHDQAREVLTHLLSLYPNSLNGLWRMANLYRETGDTANAIRYYRECLQREPNMAPARMWMERLGGGG